MMRALKPSAILTTIVLLVLSNTHHECEAVPVSVSEYFTYHVAQSYLYQLLSYGEQYQNESPDEDFDEVYFDEPPEDVDVIDSDDEAPPGEVKVIIGPIDPRILEIINSQPIFQNEPGSGTPSSEETQLNRPNGEVGIYEDSGINQPFDSSTGSEENLGEFSDPDQSENIGGNVEKNPLESPNEDSDVISDDSNGTSSGGSEENSLEYPNKDSVVTSGGSNGTSSGGSEQSPLEYPNEVSDVISDDLNGTSSEGLEENPLDYPNEDLAAKSVNSNGTSDEGPEKDLEEYWDTDSGEKIQGVSDSNLFEATGEQPNATVNEESGGSFQDGWNGEKVDPDENMIDERIQNPYDFWADQPGEVPNEVVDENSDPSGNVGETRGEDSGVNMEVGFGDPVQTFDVPSDDEGNLDVAQDEHLDEGTAEGLITVPENGTYNKLDDDTDGELTEVPENGGAGDDAGVGSVENPEDGIGTEIDDTAGKGLSEAPENATEDAIDDAANAYDTDVSEDGTSTDLNGAAGTDPTEDPKNDPIIDNIDDDSSKNVAL